MEMSPKRTNFETEKPRTMPLVTLTCEFDFFLNFTINFNHFMISASLIGLILVNLNSYVCRDEDALLNTRCPRNLELRWQTEVSSSVYATPLIADINR
jgi:hypothetical protein